jgi:hypothetical protein
MSNLIEAAVKTLDQLTEAAASQWTKITKHALGQASKQLHGSQEYHKWMGVHHSAAAHLAHEIKDKEGAKFHSKQAEAHHSKVDDDAYHDGQTHHWERF